MGPETTRRTASCRPDRTPGLWQREEIHGLHLEPVIQRELSQEKRNKPPLLVGQLVCTSLPPMVGEGWGVENGTNTKTSRRGKWGGQISGNISEHLDSALPGPTPEYFHFVSQHVPWFLLAYLSFFHLQ